MFVSLEVRFQVSSGKSPVDLQGSSDPRRWGGDESPHLYKWIFYIGVFVSKLMRLRQPQKWPVDSRLHRPMIYSKVAL